MARQNEVDPWARIRELERRLEILERANPLENASITSGPGIRVGTPEGIRGDHKDSVSITAEEGFKIAAGASGKVDAGAKLDVAGEVVAGGAKITASDGGKVGAGGTWVSSDGIIRNDGGKIGLGHDVELAPGKGVKVGAAEMSPGSGGKVGAGGTWISNDGGIRNDGGKITLVHQVDPLQGVLMSWGAGRHTLEQVTGWLQGDINSVSSRTTTAQNRADSAYSRADSAWNLADGKASVSALNTAISNLKVAIDSDLSKIASTYNTAHPGQPQINL